MRKLVYGGFLMFSCITLGQTISKYPAEDFISPMKIELQPSGTFGELRTNHFHAGLDFKTNKKEGYDIVAAADGFVSRIKYSTFGYGKAIYVTHYNGYTTVYAHLSQSNPEIEAYVKSNQYKNQSFEIELFPKRDEIKVKKGQVIALSGNSGGSAGPHLHFEYRDTATEDIINPFLFGLAKDFKDTQAPVLNNVLAYPVSDSTVVNKSNAPVTLALNKVSENSYIANKVLAKGAFGFGVNSYDMYDGHFNRNGVYRISVIVNGTPYYNITFDRFAFAESRYLNSYIDYALKNQTGEYVQKLFVKNPLPLSLLAHNKNKGTIDVKPGDNYNVIIKIYDFHENVTDVTIPIAYNGAEATVKLQETVTDYFVVANRENIYQKENITVTIPKNTFVDDFYLDFDVANNNLKLHKKTVPAYQNILLEFDMQNEIDKGIDLKKSFIALVEGNSITHLTTQTKGSKLTARTKTLGKYQILTDTVKPRIFGLSFKENDNLDLVDSFTAYISDDLSGIKSYNAYLNGKWILMAYDYKTKSLIHYFSDNVFEDGKNLLKIIVTDKTGNTTNLDSVFYKTKK